MIQWATIFGTSGGGGEYPYNLTNLAATSEDATAKLTWADPIDAAWTGTYIIRKQGGFPQHKDDGLLVAHSTMRNQYSSTPLQDTGLAEGIYFYKGFPHSDIGVNNNEANQFPQVTITYIYPSAPTAFALAGGYEKITVTRTLPANAIALDMVYKAGEAPTGLDDPTATRIDNVANAQEITGLANGTTYYALGYSRNTFGRHSSGVSASAIPIAIPRDGLICELLFADNTNDTSGTGNNGTPSNLSYADSGIPGLGRCGVFNGSNTVVNFGSVVTPYGPKTISLWVNPSAITGTYGIYDNRINSTSSAGITMRIATGNIQSQAAFGGEIAFNTNLATPIAPDKFTHVCLRWDGTPNANRVLHTVDNITYSFTATRAEATPYAQNLRLGNHITGTTDYILNGRMANLRVYNRVLSDDEIAALYTEGQMPQQQVTVGMQALQMLTQSTIDAQAALAELGVEQEDTDA